jgi:hypothetical protein
MLRRLEQRVEQMIVLHAGQRVERVELCAISEATIASAVVISVIRPNVHIGSGLSRAKPSAVL